MSHLKNYERFLDSEFLDDYRKLKFYEFLVFDSQLSVVELNLYIQSTFENLHLDFDGSRHLGFNLGYVYFVLDFNSTNTVLKLYVSEFPSHCAISQTRNLEKFLNKKAGDSPQRKLKI